MLSRNFAIIIKNSQSCLKGCRFSTDLKSAISRLIPAKQEEIQEFRQDYGNTKLTDVTVDMMYEGLLDVPALVSETCFIDPILGIRFQGYSLETIRKYLPKGNEGTGAEPLPEAMFWLLLTGEIPTQRQADAVSDEWNERATVPTHVIDLLKITTYPMATQLSLAITILSMDSKFAKAYRNGAKKTEYWEHVYEDAMDLIAKLPTIAALIYNNQKCPQSKLDIKIDPKKDWSSNFASLLQNENPDFIEFLRLYLTIHSDYESGHVGAHTTHLVGSALTDPYLSYAAGINAHAGPLNGNADQEAVEWLKNLHEAFDDSTDNTLKSVLEKEVKKGKVVPGYGHPIMVKPDHRYMCLRNFGRQKLPDNELFQLALKVDRILPQILREHSNVPNPWPTVDALSGVLLHHYGVEDALYSKILLAVSRSLGAMASLIWDRALGLPIERPKSYDTPHLRKLVIKSR